MTPATLLRHALRVLVPLAVALTVYLYLYPVFLGCGFPLPAAPQSAGAAFRSTLRQHVSSSSRRDDGSLAPFRLLALGDPQLEGDTSIPNAHRDSSFPHLHSAYAHLRGAKDQHASLRSRLRQALHDLVDFAFDDVPDTLESARKRVDLVGNDFYLAHIYRTLRWWARPSHATVLGDLLGSQWIDDAEFGKRSWRFWNRAFRGGERVPDDVAAYPVENYNVTGHLRDHNDADGWSRRLINVAGNHDVGYAGDMTVERLARFERVYGKAAYELRFALPLRNASSSTTLYDAALNPTSPRLAPELRVLVVNNMNLDTPAAAPALQDQTYAFVNDVISTSPAVERAGHFTLVLTHIPLHKRAGICVDAPHFDFHPQDEGGGVREQNLLSPDASRGFVEGIFGLSGDKGAPGGGRGRQGVILNGHDHEGCDTYHFIRQQQQQNPDDDEQQPEWEAMRWADAVAAGLVPTHNNNNNNDNDNNDKPPGLREITVRSMMGEFGGSAGLLSAWFDEAAWAWRFEFVVCALGRQEFWWFVHIFDLVVVGVAVVWGGLVVARAVGWGDCVDRWPGFVGGKERREGKEEREGKEGGKREVGKGKEGGKEGEVMVKKAVVVNGKLPARTETGSGEGVVHGETNGHLRQDKEQVPCSTS